MKKLLSLIVRRGLALFPHAVSDKLWLLLHILFENWKVPPRYPHSSNFKNKIPPDWRRQLPGVDPQSIREIEEFFRRIENDLLIWNDELILRFAVRADCIASEFLVPPENEELEYLRRRYHLNGGFESLAALHGVAFLPEIFSCPTIFTGRECPFVF